MHNNVLVRIIIFPKPLTKSDKNSPFQVEKICDPNCSCLLNNGVRQYLEYVEVNFMHHSLTKISNLFFISSFCSY